MICGGKREAVAGAWCSVVLVRPHGPGHPVWAVPLAAFIPSRVPAGAMGRVRVRGLLRRGL